MEGPAPANSDWRHRWSALPRSYWDRTWPPLAPSLESITLGLGFVVFATGLLATFAAWLGVFRWVAPLLLVALTLGTGVVAALAVRRRLVLSWPAWDWVAIAVSCLVGLFAGLLHHAFTHARMDIGFYHADAVIIATTGARTLSGPFDGLLPGFEPANGGYALGIAYGYSSLAALFVYVGGPAATPWVNSALILITMLSLYGIGRDVASRISGLLAMAFFASSLLTVWFSRWLMTENASIAAFWWTTLVVLTLRRRPSPRLGAALIIGCAYAAVARPEGPLVAAWIVLVAAALLHAEIIRIAKSFVRRRPRGAMAAAIGLVVVGVGVLLVALSLAENYRASGLRLLGLLFQGRIGADSFEVPVDGPGPNWGDYALRFEWESFQAYGLHWFALAGLAGVAAGTSKPKRLAVALLLGLPYVLFILLPPVTTFHPWFMRRLWIWLVPLVLLAAAAGLDPRRLGLRWPVREGRTPRPRLALSALAVLVIALLLATNLDPTSKVFNRREDDGADRVLPWLASNLPPGTTLVLDEDVVGYATRLRVEYGYEVIPWIDELGPVMENLTRPGHQTRAILRLGWLDVPFLEPATGLRIREERFTVNQVVLERHSLGNYITNPPFERGYDPFAEYLAASVPPARMQAQEVPLSLLLFEQDVVFQKNVAFDNETWELTPDGLRAAAGDGALTIPRQRFNQDFLANRTLAVFFVLAPRSPLPPMIWALGSDGEVEVRLSDNQTHAWGATTARYTLPQPMTADAVFVPAGTVVRGAYFGLV